MRRITLVVLAITSLAGLQSMSQKKNQQPLEVVASVDLERYMGRWHEVARLPNPFQEDCAGDVTATYTLLGDNEIKVVNRCRGRDGKMKEVEGRARRARPDGPPTKLEVRFAPAFLSFLPFVWGDYWIIDLDPDYHHAVVGEPDRRYLWVLSRTPDIPQVTLNGILDRMQAQGYDLTGLIKTEHLQ